MDEVDSSVVCLTSDIDWADEWMIESLFELCDRFNVPVTPFVTHESDAIESRYSGREEDVGVHPNFDEDSTQGDTIDDVIDRMMDVWPAARCYRTHRFNDSTRIGRKLAAAGFEFDSNLLLHLDSLARPVKHNSGTWRYPVFLEDDIYFFENSTFSFDHIAPHLKTPGIKILNFHPIHVALNTPSQSFYDDVKSAEDVTPAMKYDGPGTATLLEDILSFVTADPAVRVTTITDLHDELVAE